MSSEQKKSKGTTYILGDIGGQVNMFNRSLESIGVDTSKYILPRYVNLIQLGDVVRINDSESLDNAAVLKIVDQLKKNNPNSYTQLWGNHEYGVINWRFPGAGWRVTDDHVKSIAHGMKSWKKPDYAKIAAAVGNTLITHAGLTHGQWVSLGKPQTAQDTAKALNKQADQILSRKSSARGYMLNRYTPENDTDCLWAEAATETYPSWITGGEPMPFDQVHGHDTPFDHIHGRLKPHTSRAVAENMTVDRERRRTVFNIDGRTITCVDWMLSDHFHENPWELLKIQS